MQKLHLVGFTTDHEGLILSARRGARSGSFLLSIDASLEEAVDDLRARRAEEPEVDGVAAPPAPRRPRVESALSVREMQARLRQGRSIADVARAAGVDVEWVDRFAPPVLAERAQVITKVRSVPLRRARLGPSVLPIGDAVRQNLADRGVSQTADEFAAGWTARQLADGRWTVRFTYRFRGRDHALRFDLDEATGEVSTTDRASGQLGYVAPRTSTATATSAERPRSTKPAPEPRPTAKRAVVSTGFRPEPTAKAVSRSAKEREKATVALRKAAARRAVEDERAAARKARERREAAARREREERAAAAEAARNARAAAQAAAEAARAKAEAVKKAAADRKAAAAKRAAAAPKAEAAASRAANRSRGPSKAAPASKKAAPTKNKKAAPTKNKKAAPAKKGKAAAKRTGRTAPAAPATKAASKRRTTAARSAPRAASTRKVAPPKKAAAERSTAAAAPPPTAARASRPTPVPAVRSTRRSAAVPSVLVDPAPRDVRVEEPSPDGARLTGAAANVYGAESARALFRRGLVEKVSGDVRILGPVTAARAEPPGNGAAVAASPREPDRPRRTRPLRAT